MIRPCLYIATPTRDNQVTGAARDTLMHIALTPGRSYEITYDIEQSEENLVVARSVMIRRFLEREECTHLLFVDADVCFAPAVVEGMLATGEHVVLTPYPRMRIDWERIRRRVLAEIKRAAIAGMLRRPESDQPEETPEEIDVHADVIANVSAALLPPLEAIGQSYPIQFLEGAKLDKAKGTLDVLGAGIGCSLWSREVLAALTLDCASELTFDAGPKLDTPTVAVTSLLHEGRDLLSEDLSLCRRALYLGFQPKLFLGQGSPASHVGSYLFRGMIEAFGKTEGGGG